MNSHFLSGLFLFSAVTILPAAEPSPKAAESPTSKAAADTSAPKPAESPVPELTSRQQNLLMQLSDAEANIQVLNNALRSTGYKVGLGYDQIDSARKGNELMDRKGGGPVRWDAFYGKTTKEYGANGWGDHQPKQFQFIYKANTDQMNLAKEQIATALKNQVTLLQRREKHESNQTRLWATLAFEQIKDREIAFQPLNRFNLASTANPPDARPELLRPFVLYLRNADAAAQKALESVESNPGSAFATLNAAMEASYKVLQNSYADNLGTQTLSADDAKRAEALKDLSKRMAEETKVLSDNHRNALDRAQAKEDNSKLRFRGELQASLAKFAGDVGTLDELVREAAKAWSVEPKKGEVPGDKITAQAALTSTDQAGVKGEGPKKDTPTVIEIAVPATRNQKTALEVAQIKKGSVVKITPLDGKWSGGGTGTGKFSDWTGYSGKGGWMALAIILDGTVTEFRHRDPIQLTAKQEGKLFLFCVDNASAANVGSIKVKVEIFVP